MSRGRRPGAGLLGASVVGAANSANAARPFTRRGPLSIPSFFAGWLTSELPLHTIALQAIGTAAYGVRHGFRSRRARAALAIDLASWTVLASLHRTARRAADEFVAPFETAGIDPPPRETPGLGRLANPFTDGRGRFLRAGNVAYDEPAGRRHLLDVWAPPELAAGANAPVLLQIHGGGWVIGNKEEQGRPLMTRMCEQGWVCVAINYRLSPRATWPDHIVDVKRAIAWTRAHIADHGGDPGFIAVTGGSAGGHLAALAALTAGDPAFQPGFEDADTGVQAAVPFYGVYDFRNHDGTGRDDMAAFLERTVLKVSEQEAPELWDAASPVQHTRTDAPPFLIVHGTNDSLVPVESARSFASRLDAVSEAPVLYVELPGAQHAFEVFSSMRALHTVRSVAAFLDHVHRNATTTPTRQEPEGSPR